MKDNKENEIFAAASSGECTGLIPEGGNHTPEEIESYRDIMPFAVPAKDKDCSKTEMKKAEQNIGQQKQTAERRKASR